MAVLLITLVLRKIKERYSFDKGKGRINHLLLLEDLKLYGYTGNEVDSLVQTVKVVHEHVGISFGIEKYAALAMKRGKEVECNKIDLGDGRVIQSADDVGYKYLGILNKRDVCQHKVK